MYCTADVLAAVGRASQREANCQMADFQRGVYSVAIISTVATMLGVLGFLFHFAFYLSGRMEVLEREMSDATTALVNRLATNLGKLGQQAA